MAKKVNQTNQTLETIETVEHPSLKGYVPSEPIPEGYKLEMVSFPEDGFAVEWLVPIVAVNAIEKAA